MDAVIIDLLIQTIKQYEIVFSNAYHFKPSCITVFTQPSQIQTCSARFPAGVTGRSVLTLRLWYTSSVSSVWTVHSDCWCIRFFSLIDEGVEWWNILVWRGPSTWLAFLLGPEVKAVLILHEHSGCKRGSDTGSACGGQKWGGEESFSACVVV